MGFPRRAISLASVLRIDDAYHVGRKVRIGKKLESGASRRNTRESDRAVNTLTARGITPEVRAHLRRLVEIAKRVAPPQYPSDPAVQERNAALLELRAWYKDWSETARAVITRKDYLIMLGLSKRRRTFPQDPR